MKEIEESKAIKHIKSFLDENFLLETETAKFLYHEHASKMPVIDYHCHLSPQDIAEDRKFKNLTQIWLDGDHYKWRAMRTNGVSEKYCTGNASDYEKFQKWACTVPYTMRNPLYHWTHLELKNYFGIEKLLNDKTAGEVYDLCSTMLQTDSYSVRNILRKMKVETLCTTDDPVDNLEHHIKLKKEKFEIKVLPTFRPDKILNIEDNNAFLNYITALEKTSGITITSFQNLLDAIKNRHDFFHDNGCRLSDHGLEKIYAEDYSDAEIQVIFSKAINKKGLSQEEVDKFKSAMLIHLALFNHEKGWVQQYHLGALRNNNSRKRQEIGPDSGFDSIGDFNTALSLAKFLDKVDKNDKLTKTIIYNLNPADNEIFATMTGNFNDGSTPGKIQYGAAWWFLDQKEGIEKQLNTLSNMGLLSRFVGMVTDSRSFLSYPRHEYFRRILCNLIGTEIEKGELPASELTWISEMVENISYYNAKNYFPFQ